MQKPPFGRLAVVASLLLSHCGPSKDGSTTAGVPVVNNDQGILANRIDYVSADVALVDTPAAALLGGDPGIKLTLIGELRPPGIGDGAVQANDLVVSGNRVYVAYNVAGERQAGALDVIDTSDALHPKLVSEVLFSDRDVNGLSIAGDVVYFVGATSAAKVAPAYLATLSLSGGLLTNKLATYDLTSFAGTSVAVDGDNVYALSGDGGSLRSFARATMKVNFTLDLKDARAVAVGAEANQVQVLSGRPGALSTVSSAGILVKTVALGGATIPESKSTLQLGKTMAVAAVGDGGVKIVCTADGSIGGSVDAVKQAGLAATASVTNAAAIGSGLLFAADGEAGVYVYAAKASTADKKSGCDTVALTALGSLGFADKPSANALYVSGKYLFVATGKGGLKILYVEKAKVADDLGDFNQQD